MQSLIWGNFPSIVNSTLINAAEIIMKKLPILAFVMFLLAGCSHDPIYNVQAHTVPMSAQSLSLKQMENVIVEAGQSRGWKFQPVSPGILRAAQEQPKYAAVVEIRFTQTSYSIQYVSSRGFEFKDGIIHSHYNFWIRNLENDIDTRLSNAAFRAQ
jgi:uncharacterized lipoprotein YajG